MSGWFDVTRPLSQATPVWPGDEPWRYALTASIADGAIANVGAISGTTHGGTHADAPFHVDPDGDAIDRLPLETFLGEAWLLDLTRPTDRSISADDIAAGAPAGAERLLLRTGCDWSGGVPPEYRSLSAEAAAWCAEAGIRLVGTDAPSVDPPGSGSLPAHRALVAGGVAILESLDLAELPPGRYEFIALPLRLSGADASPVRAVARPIL